MRRVSLYLALGVLVGHFHSPCTRAISAIQDPLDPTKRRENQRVVEDHTQHAMLDLEALCFLLETECVSKTKAVRIPGYFTSSIGSKYMRRSIEYF